MDRTLAGVLGAVSALAFANPGNAAPAHTPLSVASYADLLRPIPNAAQVLQALDAGENPAQVEQVQLGPVVRDLVRGRHHHHHHHRRYYRHHHHHHHHHHGYYR